MNKLLQSLAAILLCTTSISAFTAVEANRMVEFTFESVTTYQDPFNEVTLDAVFTDPAGVRRRVPAFWAGGATWRVRYASPVTGVHRFQTECSDTRNAGLHGVRGEVTITTYTGDNPLFHHGPVRVADDLRHFAHADGAPFFWLGDTWWMGLTKRLSWPEDFQQLTADRRAKGFTVVQIVAGLYPDMPAFDERGVNETGFPWERNYARIRPEYFDAADRRIAHLAEQGIVPCIVGAWGYHLPWLGVEKMKQHWRYLVARWGAWPVVWCVSGEQTMPWYLSGSKDAEREQLKREWTDVIRYLRRIDGFNRLVTTHPSQNARDSVTDPFVLDFEMQQTGHGASAEQQAAKALRAWQALPVMPVISGESRYEALEIKPVVTTRDVRQAFWAHLLNSGCAGHTYGANGLWQLNLPDLRYGKSPGGNDWGSTPWMEAMRMPGSTQLAAAKRFLLTQPWHRLGVVTSLASVKDKPAELVPTSAIPDGTFALCYALTENSVIVDLSRFAGPVNAQWFDPARGEAKPIDGSPFPNRDRHDFIPPGKNSDGDLDWVLILKTAR